MNYATVTKIEELKQAKSEALKLISIEGFNTMRDKLLEKCTRETEELTANSLLVIAANYEKLGLDAIVGLVAMAVAAEILNLSSGEDQSQSEELEQNLESEAKDLHVELFGTTRSVRKVRYQRVIRSLKLSAECRVSIAQKHHRSGLVLGVMMTSGRLSGAHIWFKISNMTSLDVCKLLVEMTRWESKQDVWDETEMTNWLKRKARTNPYKKVS